MNWESDIVIGLEIHIEVNTNTKLFCSCPTKGTEIPNSRVCPVCLGHPGSRPVLNSKVVEYGVKLALALGSDISPEIIFSRKSYFYPDMAKNFQITQYEEPLASGGSIKLASNEIKLTRIHIEEDPAALSYPKGMNDSPFCYIDYNRAGNPLLEIVTEPDITSPKQAREFLNNLSSVLMYIGIFDPQEGNVKADANISLKESGYQRVEIKNITGFREIERALNFEVTRQRAYLRRGVKLKRETRGWNPLSRTTFPMRTKETEEDYGYIIEPDIPICDLEKTYIDRIKETIPELAPEKAKRYVGDYGIDSVDAQVISSDPAIASLFELILKEVDPIFASKWFRGELLRVLNYNKKTIRDVDFTREHLVALFRLIYNAKISEKTGKRIIELLMEEPFDIERYVKDNDLMLVSDENQIEEVCRKVVSDNPKAVEDYRSGEAKSFNYLVGQVMKETRGRASPELVKSCLEKHIK